MRIIWLLDDQRMPLISSSQILAERGPGDFVGGYNLMRYIFDPLSNFPEVIGDDSFERLALINVRYFRRRTLRVRSKQYFSSLMTELLNNKNFPSFERC